MAKKTKQKDEPIPERVFCRDCDKSSDFGDNSCYCAGFGRRVCAAENYGKPGLMCREHYKPIKHKKHESTRRKGICFKQG